MFPLKRRDGGLIARGLLRNATLPLHGAVKDYGWVSDYLQPVYKSVCRLDAQSGALPPLCHGMGPSHIWPAAGGAPTSTHGMHGRYFYATLHLGTPARQFAVIVDTGSTITYVPCASCGKNCGPHHKVPLPSSRRSYL